MKLVSATELQNNVGKYLKEVQNGEEIMILKNGKNVARLISEKTRVEFLSDSLAGILSGEVNLDEEREKALREKYGLTD